MKIFYKKGLILMQNQYIIKIRNSFSKYIGENGKECGITDAKTFSSKKSANEFAKQFQIKKFDLIKKI